MNGFASETDANVIAHLTLLQSSDTNLRYSGLLGFWVFGRQEDLDEAVFSVKVREDINCVHEFWRRYKVSEAGTLSRDYDQYLKSQGQEVLMATEMLRK